MVSGAADDDCEWDDCNSDDECSPEDESTLAACAHCGQSIYDDSPQCPHCGTYLPTDTNPLRGRPWWWLALGLSGVVAVALGALLM